MAFNHSLLADRPNFFFKKIDCETIANIAFGTMLPVRNESKA